MAAIRKTPKFMDHLAPHLIADHFRRNFSHSGVPAIGNGTTAGTLRTNASVVGHVAGVDFTKASTDDLWDLSSETDTAAATFRAYWLYVNAAGTASFAAGSDVASAAAALASLPAPDAAKCVFGVYVAGAATDFDDAGGLAAQGTVYNGVPAGAKIGELVLAAAVTPLSLVYG